MCFSKKKYYIELLLTFTMCNGQFFTNKYFVLLGKLKKMMKNLIEYVIQYMVLRMFLYFLSLIYLKYFDTLHRVCKLQNFGHIVKYNAGNKTLALIALLQFPNYETVKIPRLQSNFWLQISILSTNVFSSLQQKRL